MTAVRVLFALVLLAMLALPGLAAPLAGRCVLCNGPIAKTEGYRYRELDGKRWIFHAQHNQVPQACFYCEGVLSPFTPWGSGRMLDGKPGCRRCASEAVYDVRAAQALLNAVRREMSGWGMNIPWGPIPVRFGDAAAMNAAAGRSGPTHDAVGLCTFDLESLNGKTRLVRVAVIVRAGIPRTHLGRTMAHELTHAWAGAVGCPMDQEPALREGAANLVAYYHLQQLGTKAADRVKHRMLVSPDPVYGEGMRRMMAYAKRHRIRGALAVLAKDRQIPRGY